MVTATAVAQSGEGQRRKFRGQVLVTKPNMTSGVRVSCYHPRFIKCAARHTNTLARKQNTFDHPQGTTQREQEKKWGRWKDSGTLIGLAPTFVLTLGCAAPVERWLRGGERNKALSFRCVLRSHIQHAQEQKVLRGDVSCGVIVRGIKTKQAFKCDGKI